ncbi:MAG: Hcp1 family type secretion system effector [Pedosphaera sp.]|nr:Hcp1 family type secretion system effector [Pedosphaera sp.]
MFRRTLLRLVAMITLLAAIHSQAQTIVLHIPNVTGDATSSPHVGDMDIDSFNWSVATAPSGSGTGGVGPPTFSDVSISKLVDRATPTLAQKCAAGANLGTVVIYVTKATTNGLHYDYYRVTLGQAYLTGDSVSGGGNGQSMQETLTLRFSTIQWLYTPVDSQGVPQTPITTQYP